MYKCVLRCPPVLVSSADAVPAAELLLPAWINGAAQMASLIITVTPVARRQLEGFVAAGQLEFYGRDEADQVPRPLVGFSSFCVCLVPFNVTWSVSIVYFLFLFLRLFC